MSVPSHRTGCCTVYMNPDAVGIIVSYRCERVLAKKKLKSNEAALKKSSKWTSQDACIECRHSFPRTTFQDHVDDQRQEHAA